MKAGQIAAQLGSQDLFGWINDPAEVQRIQGLIRASGREPLFANAAPHLEGIGENKTVILHEAPKKLFGSFLKSQYQPRGTCVSRGAKRACDLLRCIQIAIGAVPEKFDNDEKNYVSHAFIYGTCRMHGNYLSNEDGAVGAWAAWAVNNDGNLLNADTGDGDNVDDLAVQWGARGVSNDIITKGKQHLVTSVALCRSSDEVRDAVCALKPCTIASDVGYEPFKRDQNGFCRRGGSWPHQMCFTGYRSDMDAFLIDQSWGPDQPGGPIGSIEIPSYSFWVTRRDADVMIGQGDCWAYAGITGWAADRFSWNLLGA